MIEEILEERGNNYGDFKTHAQITQGFKSIMHTHESGLTNAQTESLEMIFHKIGRILNGNPNYKDSWVDIVGYAQLIVRELEASE